MSEHGRHLQQYFNLFVMYANLGKEMRPGYTRFTGENPIRECLLARLGTKDERADLIGEICAEFNHFFCNALSELLISGIGLAEKTQLLKLGVPATFMLVALDEGPGPPIKYQYAELGKLYTVVSQLVRCCDVTSRMQSSINGEFHTSSPILYSVPVAVALA